MQVKKKPRNAAAKKIQKASPKEKRTKKKQNEQPLLKRVIFGEERPDLTELEAGSTTILDILAPTTVDTKRKDYVVVDGVYGGRKRNVGCAALQRRKTSDVREDPE